MLQRIRHSIWLKSLIALFLLISFYETIPTEHFGKVQKVLHPVLHPLSSSSAANTKLCAPMDQVSLRAIAESNKFAEEFTYWKRHIRTTPSLSERPSYVTVNETLLPAESGFKLKGTSLDKPLINPPCFPTINLPITKSPPMGQTDLTPLIFGISTTISRLRKNSIEHFQRFLTRPASADRKKRESNGAGFIVHLHNCTDEEILEAYDLLREAGIDAVVKHAVLEQDMAERYLSLLPSLFSQSEIDKKDGYKRTWLVIMDDDTFFPRPHALLKSLNMLFPKAEEERFYVGGWRETVPDRSPNYVQLQGGAGIFLSIPMANELLETTHEMPEDFTQVTPLTSKEAKDNSLVPTANTKWKKASLFDICVEEYGDIHDGDIQLSRCIAKHTDVKSQDVPGLHQMDIFGDLSGFYESGSPFLSTHHWKSWNHYLPDRQSAVGDVCGEDCVFQRWVFQNNTHTQTNTQTSKTPPSSLSSESEIPDNLEDQEWPIVLTSGFSISQYEPKTFSSLDLEIAESTFGEFFRPLRDMDYGIGKSQILRHAVEKGKKKQWVLLEAKESAENGRWRSQWYGWRDGNGDVGKVAELVWVGE